MGATLVRLPQAHQKDIGMCYVLKPMGVQASQISTTSGEFVYEGITRPSSFLAKWSQEGTRCWPPQVMSKRYLCHYRRSGEPEFITAVPDDPMNGRWYWLTQAPVGFPFGYLRAGLDHYTGRTEEEYDQDR